VPKPRNQERARAEARETRRRSPIGRRRIRSTHGPRTVVYRLYVESFVTPKLSLVLPVAQFPAEYDEGRVPPFSPVSLSFPFVSLRFRLPVTPTPEPYRWLHSGAPVRALKVSIPVAQRVASPEWLNASRLGRNARTGGTATSRTT
jgi:hypothetical protein